MSIASNFAHFSNWCILYIIISGLFTGKGGYDKNLERIQGRAPQFINNMLSCNFTRFTVFEIFLGCLDFHHAVTDGTGCPTTAAMEAYHGVCSTVTSATTRTGKPEAGHDHVTVYVAKQQASFAAQQSMLLREAYNRRTKQQRQSQVQCNCLHVWKFDINYKKNGNILVIGIKVIYAWGLFLLLLCYWFSCYFSSQQHLLLTSGVTCLSKMGQINTRYSLSDLIE